MTGDSSDFVRSAIAARSSLLLFLGLTGRVFFLSRLKVCSPKRTREWRLSWATTDLEITLRGSCALPSSLFVRQENQGLAGAHNAGTNASAAQDTFSFSEASPGNRAQNSSRSCSQGNARRRVHGNKSFRLLQISGLGSLNANYSSGRVEQLRGF